MFLFWSKIPIQRYTNICAIFYIIDNFSWWLKIQIVAGMIFPLHFHYRIFVIYIHNFILGFIWYIMIPSHYTDLTWVDFACLSSRRIYLAVDMCPLKNSWNLQFGALWMEPLSASKGRSVEHLGKNSYELSTLF